MASRRQILHSAVDVPGRAGKILLVVGFVALLVLVIGLFSLTRGGSTQAATPQPRPSIEEAPVVAPAPSGDGRVFRAAPAAKRERPAAPRAAITNPEPLPQIPAGEPSFERAELKRDANGKLVPIMYVADLRAQNHMTDAPIKNCLERWGQRATGKATLSFTVAAQRGKLAIDTTGVQDEESLGGNPALLDCLHQTAYAFQLDGFPIPELGTPIYVRRKIRVENGELVENNIFDFSYVH